MAVGNVGNVLMGPASLYAGVLGVITASPADAAINAAPAASAWTDLGGTNGGISFDVAQKFTALELDQVVDTIDERLTGRTITVVAALGEATLSNLATSLNCVLQSPGSNYQKFVPVYDSTASQTQKISLILDGFAPPVTTPTPIASPRRRIYLPRCQQTGEIKPMFAKDKQVLFECTFTAYYVSNSVPPYAVTDQIGV